jgi:hypothetical protein
VLCGDDSCIGTVGPDKRCKVCGNPYEGDVEVRSEPPPAQKDGGPETPPGSADDAPAKDRPGEDHAAPGTRVCCPDDACVGIIGPNGACGICGKSA